MMTLKDAPGGTKFMETLIDAAKDLSLAFAATPDERALPHLQRFLKSIEPGIIEAVGASNAPDLLNAFRKAVVARKREIEEAMITEALQ